MAANDDGEKVFEHESYGMIQVSRLTGGDTVPMFGSNLERIPHRIAIRINRGVRRHSLGRDWFHGKDEIIEVYLTPNQYAEMITNPNSGSGVPCTISHILRKRMAEPPRVESEASAVRDRFAEQTANLRVKAEEGAKKIAALLETTKLSAKAKEEINTAFWQATRFLGDEAPFLVSSFQESVQKTVVEAKREIDAFMTHAIHSAGLEAIAGSFDAPLLLEATAVETPIEEEIVDES